MLNTKSLVVGQEVKMVSGVYGEWGKVTKIIPTGRFFNKNFVEVMIPRTGKTILFDPKGIAYDGSHTFECGLWELELPTK